MDLRSRPLVLDAALGTELSRAGLDTRPPLWSARALLDAPEVVRLLHEREVLAGADVLTANTFRTHRRTLEREGLGERARELTELAVSLCRAAASTSSVLVAGSLAPLEDCYRPELMPDDQALEAEHRLQAESLAAADVDLILVETMGTLRELRTATAAALATGLPVVACAVTDGAGRLLSGEGLEDAARALLSLSGSPLAIGVNCVPARRLGGEIQRLARAAPGVPLAAYGNAGLPSGSGYTEPIEPDDHAALAASWVSAGARLVGGCCGLGPAYTRAVRERIRGWSSPAASGP